MAPGHVVCAASSAPRVRARWMFSTLRKFAVLAMRFVKSVSNHVALSVPRLFARYQSAPASQPRARSGRRRGFPT